MSEPDGPTLICVSLRELINSVGAYPANQELYSRFPLQDIIASLLSTKMYDDPAGHQEAVFAEIEERFPGKDDFDYEVLAIFFDTVIELVDETIRRQVSPDIDTGEYIFHEWADDFSCVLWRYQYGNEPMKIKRIPFHRKTRRS